MFKRSSLQSYGCNRFFKVISILVVYLLISSMTIHVLSTNMPYSEDMGDHVEYYWLRPGVYFNYTVYNEYNQSLILNIFLYRRIEPTGYIDFRLAGQYIANKLTISWRVIDVFDRYMLVEYIIYADKAEYRVNNTVVNRNAVLEIRREYIVDIETLDTYTVGENNNLGKWVGEWPFLIHPELSTEKGVKMLCIQPSGFSVQVKYLDKLVKFIEQINETVYNVTDGKREYNVTVVSELASLTNLTVSFIETIPPPTDTEFRLNNISLSGNRIIGSERIDTPNHVPEELKNIFNKIYNSSNHRPLYFIESPILYKTEYKGKTYTVKYLAMIDEEGDVYITYNMPDIRVYYDSITNTLLKIEADNEKALHILIGFKDLFNKYGITASTNFGKIYIELTETNIDFGRPVFGKVSGSNMTENSYSEGYESTGLTLIVVPSIIVAVIAVMFLIRKKRVR